MTQQMGPFMWLAASRKWILSFALWAPRAPRGANDSCTDRPEHYLQQAATAPAATHHKVPPDLRQPRSLPFRVEWNRGYNLWEGAWRQPAGSWLRRAGSSSLQTPGTRTCANICAQLMEEPSTGSACSQQQSNPILKTTMPSLARTRLGGFYFLCCAPYSSPHQLEGQHGRAPA